MPVPEETYALYAHEGELVDFDGDAACERLSAAIRIPTVTGAEASVFHELHELIKRSFPLVCSLGTFETFGQNVLITVEGSDPSLEALIMIAHQDVVPADEAEWTHPPFTGYRDGAYIWGRGSLDIKGMMFAELEALELALRDHGMPRRTVILAFGDDEETDSKGATELAAVLEQRGVRGAFLLDEGTTSHMDGAAFGVPGMQIQGICLSQKGFMNIRLCSHGAGGHSSNPFGGTSLERIALAIECVRSAMPAPRLTPLIEAAAERLGLVADEGLLNRYVGQRDTFPYAADTMAVTQIEGSSPAANALPEDASATINLRLLPGTDAEALVAAFRAAIPQDVSLEVIHATPAARVDAPQGPFYDALVRAFERCYPGVAFVPLFMVGGCDAIRYERVTSQSIRILPYLAPPADEARIHAVDERISERSYLHAIALVDSVLEQIVF